MVLHQADTRYLWASVVPASLCQIMLCHLILYYSVHPEKQEKLFYECIGLVGGRCKYISPQDSFNLCLCPSETSVHRYDLMLTGAAVGPLSVSRVIASTINTTSTQFCFVIFRY